MSDNKTYTWMFDLRENSMTKDVKEDYTAIVRTLRSMTVEFLARVIAFSAAASFCADFAFALSES